MPAIRHALALLLAAMPAVSATAAPAVPAATDARLTSEHRAWIDDHARWNAQHLAAARRLEAVAAALRRHDTSFDRHGLELRQHEREVVAAGHGPATRKRHTQMRAAHIEAAASHRRLMDEVADLESTIAADLTAAQFQPR